MCNRRPDGRNAPIMPPVVNKPFPTASVDIAGLTQESEFFDGEGDVISRGECGFDLEESGGGISECHAVQAKTLSSLTSGWICRWSWTGVPELESRWAEGGNPEDQLAADTGKRLSACDGGMNGSRAWSSPRTRSAAQGSR